MVVRQNLDRHLVIAALLLGALVAFRSPAESSLSAYLAGAAGLIAIHERLRAEFPRRVALVATILIFAGTSLFWSMTRAGSFTDAAAFGLAAALLLLAHRLKRGGAVIWVLVAAAPFAILFWIRGSSQLTEATTAPWSARLFSSSQGLLSLTPVVYIALLGTIAYLRHNAMWTASALAVFAVWLIAGAVGVSGASSASPFGHGLTAALALCAPGLALVIDRARARPLAAVAPLVLLAIAWNHWLMVQYTVGLLPKDAPVSFADMVRQQADVHTGGPYVYPFAFPANLVFAWRENMPADRYELLAFEPRRHAIDAVMDRSMDRFLLDGWDAPGPDPLGPVHWIGRSRATIALPLDVSSSRAVEVTVTARTRLEEPAVNANMALEINGQEIGRFVAPSAAPIEFRTTVPADAVGRIFREGYNRLTFVSYGVHRVDTGVPSAAPLATLSGSRAWPVAIYRIRVTPVS